MTRRIGWLITGVLIAIVAIFVGGYLFIKAGGVPMATSAAPLPLEASVARLALRASDQAGRNTKDPLPVNEDNLSEGAAIYREHCLVCHGAPGQPSPLALAMFPTPPQLFEPQGMVTDDPEGITYWKVTNGIRLSGMPGFTKILSDEDRWRVTMTLAHADKLPDRARAALTPAQGK